jgi:hypothetical protein
MSGSMTDYGHLLYIFSLEGLFLTNISIVIQREGRGDNHVLSQDH